MHTVVKDPFTITSQNILRMGYIICTTSKLWDRRERERDSERQIEIEGERERESERKRERERERKKQREKEREKERERESERQIEIEGEGEREWHSKCSYLLFSSSLTRIILKNFLPLLNILSFYKSVKMFYLTKYRKSFPGTETLVRSKNRFYEFKKCKY